jgi:S1-C subfamily serine protease
MSRETRLLVVTISLSVLVLVLLSRFRFPDRPAMTVVPPAPLERLAARATYDELAALVSDVQRGISPNLMVLRVAEPTDRAPRRLQDLLQSGAVDSGVLHVPALRITQDRVIAAVPPHALVLGIAGEVPGETPPLVIATDPVRRLALVQVPATDGGPVRALPLSALQTPSYVVVVEGTRGGLSFRPLFVGSGDRFEDPRWQEPLLAVSSAALTSPGALFFSTEGHFLGVAMMDTGTLALADARDILSAGDRLARGEVARPIDAGVALQPLTTALAAALAASHGVVVADVTAGGPADGVLQTADVIFAVDGERIDSVHDFLLLVAQKAAGPEVRIGLIRDGKPLELSLTFSPATPPTQDTLTGMTLGSRREGGSVVLAVTARSPADAAGIRTGDAILQAGNLVNPTPDQLSKLADSSDRPFLAITLEREGRRHIVALPVQ